jgi:hypothetical protein
VGRRKGRFEEALSRAIHADDPELYKKIFARKLRPSGRR